jgi:hypothetical protein
MSKIQLLKHIIEIDQSSYLSYHKLKDIIVDNIILYNIDIKSRLNMIKDQEMITILLFSFGIINCDEFEFKINSTNNHDSYYNNIIINCCKEIIIDEGIEYKSHTVDIFIPQAIPDAVAECKQILDNLMKYNNYVSWGNTNLFPSNYADALKLASITKYNVKFIKWGFELPKLNLNQLYIRNIKRFLLTGKYVPITTLSRCIENGDNIIQDAGGYFCNDYNLAHLAGFEMDDNGFVYLNESV